MMNSAGKRKYANPWRRGNRFRLLVDGNRFLPVMLTAIAEAKRYILIELYLCASGRLTDRFIAALAKAAVEGKRVCLLLDDFGSYHLVRADRQRLVAAGAELVFYNPIAFGRGRALLFRNHRKLLLVDGRIAFTGGFGLTDDFAPDLRPQGFWHETVIEVEGPCVADWQTLFLAAWKQAAGAPLALPEPEAVGAPGGAPGRVILQYPFPGRSEVMRSHISSVRRARRRVWLATAYFLPSWKLRKALRRAVRNGVDVRVLLPGAITDHPAVGHLARRYYGRLLRAGVRIFEYQRSFLHAKVLLCDNRVSVGSSNMDRWNYRFNLEANQEAADSRLAAAVAEQFEADFDLSLEISFELWNRRPRLRRLQEWVWTQVGRIVWWLGQRTKGM
jgi:cardiolipin synthase